MTNKSTTNVLETDMDIDELLDIPGADSVMIANEGDDKKNVFSSMNPNTDFLDKKPPVDPPAEPNNPPATPSAEPNPNDILDLEKQSIATKNTTTLGAVNVAKKLIEKGIIFPFEGDEKPIEEYEESELEELFELNLKHQLESQAEELTKTLPEQMFQNMPTEMQQAYQYIANGGTDIKGMFRALSSALDIQTLNIEKESDQKTIIRTYLEATRWGTPEEIEDEIISLEDKNEISKKAKQFKPKLDSMQEEIVQQKIENEKINQAQRQKRSQQYMDSVYNTLEKAELNGIKLDNKTQSMLYAGLIQPNYPSISGKQTNMLGHLLEKYQWVEPNHALIAEALWLLADPENYRKSISENVKKEVTTTTMKTLKTEQSSKNGSGTSVDEGEGNTRKIVIKKDKGTSFFKRGN